jgi:hypothetical protein
MDDLLVNGYKKSIHRGHSEIRVKDIFSLIKHDKKMFFRAIKLLSFEEGKNTIYENMKMKEEYS